MSENQPLLPGPANSTSGTAISTSAQTLETPVYTDSDDRNVITNNDSVSVIGTVAGTRTSRISNKDGRSKSLQSGVRYYQTFVNNETNDGGTPSDVLNGDAGSDRRPASSETRVYRARWYILVIVSVATMLQNTVWASWGPIAQSAKAVYNWQTSTVAVMINCGNVGVFVSLIFAGYLVRKKGLRVSMVACVFLMALGTGLRVITMVPLPATVLIGAGQFFNGVAGSITQVIPPKISETWFPSNERTTATAVGVLSNAVGAAAAFLLGPSIVPQPNSNSTQSNYNGSDYNQTTTDADEYIMRDRIRLLNIIEFCWGAALLVMVLLYFPGKPKNPPSISASKQRPQFKQGLSKLTRQWNVWSICLICAIPWAVAGNWLGMLDVNLQDLVITQVGLFQEQAGWFGFYASAAGAVGGTIIGRIVDVLFQRHIKLLLTSLYVISLILILWVTAMCNGFLPRSQVMLGVAIASLGTLMNGAVPLFYETLCELVYPVSEEIVAMFIGLVKNATAVVFLLVQVIPYVGTRWMNWCFVGVLGASLPILLMYKELYRRMDVDKQHSSESNHVNVNA